MVLYCNLAEVKVNDADFAPKPVLKLTSTNISGKITSNSPSLEIDRFKSSTGFSESNISLIDRLFAEAKTNNFEVIIEGV